MSEHDSASTERREAKIRTVKESLVILDLAGVPARRNEVGHIVVGEERLRGEVLRIRGDRADMQVFEDTRGVRVGDTVELRATVTLVDPRNLSDERFLAHQTFEDQAQLADVLEDRVDVLRLAVGGEAHDLVFARVHLEARVVGERAVEHADRVREVDRAEELELVALSHAVGRGRPLADAVDREHGRLVEGRGVERRGRVRLVVLSEEDLALVAGELLTNHGARVELLAQPHRHGLHELRDPLRRDAEVGLQDPLELEDRLVVERDRAEVGRGDPRLAQAVVDRVAREARVVLLAGEALLLGRGEDLAVAEQRGGAVVVVRADSEHVGGLAHGTRRLFSCGAGKEGTG